MVGSKIGKYLVTRKLGEGGMGAVYEALDEQLGRHVAIKVLHPELGHSPDLAARLFNEARVAHIVRHSCLVDVFEFGQLPDGAYLVMEYLEGEPLSARLARRQRREGSVPTIDLLHLLRQVASALAAVHEKRIIHRDLKPENVMIVADSEAPGGERARVLDFGIAKVAEDHRRGLHPTRTGTLMGTPLYMAPEQCRGAGSVDDRADVYSLGVILYEVLTGSPPFVAEGSGEIMAMHLYEEPLPVREHDQSIPDPLAQLSHAMLQKDPTLRLGMKEVARELARLCTWLASTTWSGTKIVEAEEAGRPVLSSRSFPRPSTTLSGAAGQGSAPLQRRKFMAAIVGSLALGAIIPLVGIRLPQKNKIEVVAVTKTEVRPMVRWSLRSTPPGAQVVRVADKKVLGTTPWSSEEEAGAGELALLLRHPGYFDLPLALDRESSTRREDRLTPLPADAEREKATENTSPTKQKNTRPTSGERSRPTKSHASHEIDEDKIRMIPP